MRQQTRDVLRTVWEIGRLLHNFVGQGLHEREFVEKASKEDRLVYVGALAISVAAVVQILQKHHLGIALSTSVVCFAASIPLLTVGVYLMSLELDYRKSVWSRLLFLAMSVGLLATMFGLVGVFWYFHPLVGVLFFFFCLFAFSLATGAKESLKGSGDRR